MALYRVELRQRRGLHQFPRLALKRSSPPSSPLLVSARSPYRGYHPRIGVSAVGPTPIRIASCLQDRFRSSFILTLRLYDRCLRVLQAVFEGGVLGIGE